MNVNALKSKMLATADELEADNPTMANLLREQAGMIEDLQHMQKNPPPKSNKPAEDEFVINRLTGQPLMVKDMTEEQAKDFVRMVVREHRHFSEFTKQMFDGLGAIAGLEAIFGNAEMNEEINLASVMPGSTKLQ